MLARAKLGAILSLDRSSEQSTMLCLHKSGRFRPNAGKGLIRYSNSSIETDKRESIESRILKVIESVDESRHNAH